MISTACITDSIVRDCMYTNWNIILFIQKSDAVVW